MKKVRFLALAMVVALGLMGAGYAYWTDTLTINSTVSTGVFDVGFDDVSVAEYVQYGSVEHSVEELVALTFDEDSTDSHESSWKNENDVFKAVIVPSDTKTVDLSMSNMFPGTKAMLKMTAVNNGTIPAVFDYAEVDYRGVDQVLVNAPLKVKVVVDGKEMKVAHLSKTLPELEDKLEEMLAGIRLETGDTSSIYLNFILPADEVSGDEAENISNSKVSITIHWKQHNAPSTDTSTVGE